MIKGELMKHVLLIAAIIGMSGCTEAKQKVVETLTPVIAGQLECSNPAAIMEDLSNWLKLEQAQQSKGIGADICKGLVGVAVDLLANQAIPEDWECKAEKLPAGLKTALNGACELID